MITRLPPLILLVAAIAAMVVAVSGPGFRLGMWPLAGAFGMFRWGGLSAIAVAVIAAIALSVVHLRYRTGGSPTKLLWLALAIAGAAALVPMRMLAQSKSLPTIHDITTDTTAPPAFVAIAPLRAGVANRIDYQGEAIAAQQRAAYPGIKPYRSADPPARQFSRALAVAREMGWKIVAASAADGRIEASDTTPFFGFVDDVVIRVAADGAGSRVDVRSLSRIGKSDVGVNARRISKYLDKLALIQP